MPNIETLTPELSESLDIQEAIGDLIASRTSQAESTRIIADVVDHIDQMDLQADRIAGAHEDLSVLMAPFRLDKVEVINSEMTLLSALSQARTRRTRGVAQFITRDATETGVDARYWHNGGWVRVEAHLQGQLEEPCTISTLGGELVIEEKEWYRGEWRYLKRDLGSERGKKLYDATVVSSIWAAHLAMTRLSEVREKADANALQLLDLELRAERGVMSYTAVNE